MSDIRRGPTWGAVLAEQFRMIGLSMRAEAALLGVLMAVLSFALGMSILREGTVVSIRPDNYVIFGALGFLLPFAVWKGRARLESGSFLTLPVEHRRLAATRVLAGWLWLMIALALVFCWLALLVILSGGTFSSPPGTTRYILEHAVPGATVARSALREVPWTTPDWHWFIGLTGSTIAYLLSSALNLATRNPLRWVAGVTVAVLLLGLATGEYAFEWLRIALHPVLVHPWGLDTALTGGSESLNTIVVVPTGEGTETVRVWRDLPTLGAWLRATTLWLAIAAAVFWAATLRFRERRPS